MQKCTLVSHGPHVTLVEVLNLLQWLSCKITTLAKGNFKCDGTACEVQLQFKCLFGGGLNSIRPFLFVVFYVVIQSPCECVV